MDYLYVVRFQPEMRFMSYRVVCIGCRNCGLPGRHLEYHAYEQKKALHDQTHLEMTADLNQNKQYGH